MSRGLPLKVINLLDKAKESALLAVDIYNKPRTAFRAGGFIVLMCIAWNSLLHAIFEKHKIRYYYLDSENNKRYQKVDGEYKAWDLFKSATEFYKDQRNPILANILFFYKLRNKIEHRFMPNIDQEIAGECQAFLLNFEELLVQNFKNKHSIIDNLFIPLQFTEQRRMLPKTKHDSKLLSFIKEFRSALSNEITNSQKYSFKAFFIPKLGNHRNTSDLAIEFVNFNDLDPNEMQTYEKMLVGIKERNTAVINPGSYKPSKVVNEVQKKTGKKVTMQWHTSMWQKYKVRPPSNSLNPRETIIEYCQYDEPHNDYIYTEKWIDLLSKEILD